jgi:hypothetical protein
MRPKSALVLALVILGLLTTTPCRADPPAAPSSKANAPSALPGLRDLPNEPAKPTPPATPDTPDTPAGKVLSKVLNLFEGNYESISADDLSDSFKEAVPLVKLRQVVAQIRMTEGDLSLESIDPGATDRALVANVIGQTRKTPLRIRLNLDEHDKIIGLLVQPRPDSRVPPITSWDDLKSRLKAAAEKSSFTIQTERDTPTINADGAPATMKSWDNMVTLNSDDPLAIGSAFKLWVLAALGEFIQSGDASWDDKLPIDDALKSLPSGVMQDQPDGKNFPLREYAAKMISISDNTATDHLIHRLGRDRCEQAMRRACLQHGDANQPFLTTRDLFALKLSGASGDALAKKYMEAGTDSRRALLPDIAKETPKLALAAFWKTPRWIDRLEWFASGTDMCRSFIILDNLTRDSESPTGDKRAAQPQIREILSINPGIPIDKKTFPFIAFKGGSEPGVMSLNWLLERTDGRRFTVSLIVNDTKKPIDEPLTIGLATRAIEFLGTWDTKSK